MRNAVIARDPVAQAAAQALIAEQGTALDMAVAGMLAGAVRGTPAALLGSGAIVIGGPGVGLHFIDACARAPGLGTTRPRTGASPAESSTAAVPGLLEGVLAAHARFGSLPLSAIVRTALAAVRESDPDVGTRARMELLVQLHRVGFDALERVGVLRSILQAVGPIAAGSFSKEDLERHPAPVVSMIPCVADGHEVAVPPRYRKHPGVHAPPALPAVDVESLVAADMHGVIVACCWALPKAAVSLPELPALALPALLPAPVKGVPRWRPGTPLPTPLPLALCRAESRAWAGLGVSGSGNLVALRDRAVAARFALAGLPGLLVDDPSAWSSDAVAAWVVRDTSRAPLVTSIGAIGREDPR